MEATAGAKAHVPTFWGRVFNTRTRKYSTNECGYGLLLNIYMYMSGISTGITRAPVGRPMECPMGCPVGIQRPHGTPHSRKYHMHYCTKGYPNRYVGPIALEVVRVPCDVAWECVSYMVSDILWTYLTASHGTSHDLFLLYPMPYCLRCSMGRQLGRTIPHGWVVSNSHNSNIHR